MAILKNIREGQARRMKRIQARVAQRSTLITECGDKTWQSSVLGFATPAPAAIVEASCQIATSSTRWGAEAAKPVRVFHSKKDFSAQSIAKKNAQVNLGSALSALRILNRKFSPPAKVFLTLSDGCARNEKTPTHTKSRRVRGPNSELVPCGISFCQCKPPGKPRSDRSGFALEELGLLLARSRQRVHESL